VRFLIAGNALTKFMREEQPCQLQKLLIKCVIRYLYMAFSVSSTNKKLTNSDSKMKFKFKMQK